MTGSSGLDALLLVALLVGAALGALGLVRGVEVDRYLTSRSAEAGHLVMNLAMAVMLTPWWAGSVRTAVLVVLAALAVGFAALLVRGGPARPAHLFHLVAAAAMIYAVLVTDHGADHMAGMDMPVDPLQSTVSWVLAGLFLLDGFLTAGVVALAPRAALVPAGAPAPPGTIRPGTTERTERALRVAAVPHVVMDLGMVAMLVMAT